LAADNDIVTYPLRADYKQYAFSDKSLIEKTGNQNQVRDGYLFID
jgi:hypothetical protein